MIKLVAFSLLLIVPTLFLDPITPACFLIVALLLASGLGRISPLVLVRNMAAFAFLALTIVAIILHLLPALHGGATAGFLEVAALIELGWGLSVSTSVTGSVVRCTKTHRFPTTARQAPA